MRRRHCVRYSGGGFFPVLIALFGTAAVVSTVSSNVHITLPAVWAQLLIGVGITAVLLGVGYLTVWRG